MKVETDLRAVFSAPRVEMAEGVVYDAAATFAAIRDRLDNPNTQEGIEEVEQFAAWSLENLPTNPLK